MRRPIPSLTVSTFLAPAKRRLGSITGICGKSVDFSVESPLSDDSSSTGLGAAILIIREQQKMTEFLECTYIRWHKRGSGAFVVIARLIQGREEIDAITTIG